MFSLHWLLYGWAADSLGSGSDYEEGTEMALPWRRRYSSLAAIVTIPVAVLFNLLLVPILLFDARARQFDKKEARKILSE